MQARARWLQDGGVLGVLFVGTEGTPFDCDDGSGSTDLPVAVVGVRAYNGLVDALASHNTSVAWVTGKGSPLELSAGFQVFIRILQTVALILYAINIWLGWKQLRRFGACTQKKKMDKGPAVPVMAWNVAASIAAAAHVLNAGPTMEAAIPPFLPFLGSRMLLDLSFQLHMIATLLLSAHFRKICAGIEKMVNGSEEDEPSGRASCSSKSGRESTRRLSSLSSKIKRRRSSIDEDDLVRAQPSSSSAGRRIPWDVVFIVAVVGMILLQFSVGVLTGMFSLLDIYTLPVTVLAAFVLTSLGLWFRYYANKVIKLMKSSTSLSPGLIERIARLSRNVRRVGTCMVTFVVATLVQEGLRQMLREGGGWGYWIPLCPFWFCLNLILNLSMHFQIMAFQAQGEEPRTATEKAKKRPAKVAALGDSSDDLHTKRPAKVAELENSSENLAIPVIPRTTCTSPAEMDTSA